MYSDNPLILHLLSLMKKFGIFRVVLSPGSRHFPLVYSMESDSDFIKYSVVDERSAAFFALGLIQKTAEPVAICCTSGTSAVNYGSAVVEAFYQGLPLVVLTADRLPELLNQKEEQMVCQRELYAGFLKYEGQLKEVKDPLTEWYCNRIINEAFLELDHNGKGPVHLNFPIEKHFDITFGTAELPVVRKISRICADVDDEAWMRYAARLENKKVMILWGQSGPMDDSLKDAIDLFAQRFNCVILADKLSNCDHPRAIQSAWLCLRSMTSKQAVDLAPDIVISLFGHYNFVEQLKNYLKSVDSRFECWDIGTSKVSDPFWRLTTIFEMKEAFFFRTLARHSTSVLNAAPAYFDGWAELQASIVAPPVGYGEIYVIGKLLQSLPTGALLQIANSLPLRITHLFKSDTPITSFCNRGVNGIDGCMSTAVGFAAATDDPVFLVIGDLAFFYDMNALWNRHLSKNLRILMLNNEGGGLMHVPRKESIAPIVSRHISAAHHTSARGWVESLGIRYYPVTNREECDKAIEILTDPAEPGPILVEAFSEKVEDVRQFNHYMKSIRNLSTVDKAKAKIMQKVPKLLQRFFSDASGHS